MSSQWRNFFLAKVPVVVVLILLVGQFLTIALQNVPLNRSYMDNLALAIERDRTPHRVVLLGDSITLNATRRFQLGRGPDDVANLATIAWTGAAAELFLLQRYLHTHSAPQHVVYASAADDLDNGDSPQLIHYYDWNVYTQPQERAFLRQYVPGIDAREWFPAMLNVQENILERLTSLGKPLPTALLTGSRPPDANIRAISSTDNRINLQVEHERANHTIKIGGLQAAVFRTLCSLGQQYGFKLEIVWPPVPVPVEQAWTQNGEISAMNQKIAQVLGPNCNQSPIFDINAIRPYTDFNRDGFHLRGVAWEERYAADLSQYLASLPDLAGKPGKPALASENTAVAAGR